MKHKQEGQGKPAAKIKKTRKAEVNYIPLHPKGENTESLENERIALLSELKQRDNEVVIKAKMEKTFSHRRLEIVEQRPMIGEFKERWPALFQESEVSKSACLYAGGNSTNCIYSEYPFNFFSYLYFYLLTQVFITTFDNEFVHCPTALCESSNKQ